MLLAPGSVGRGRAGVSTEPEPGVQRDLFPVRRGTGLLSRVRRGTLPCRDRPRTAVRRQEGRMAVGQDRGTGQQTDLRTKGLSTNSVGLLASVVLGVSSIAPVYALTATLGPTVTEVGLQRSEERRVGKECRSR